jgi:hypothetical protein
VLASVRIVTAVFESAVAAPKLKSSAVAKYGSMIQHGVSVADQLADEACRFFGVAMQPLLPLAFGSDVL